MRWFGSRRLPAPASPQALASIAASIDRIEAEMKRIGYWSADPPDLQAEVRDGRLASYLDAPSFELWLQQVFVPNARRAVADHALPRESRVGVMAMRQYDYHAFVPEAQGLLAALRDFDAAVEACGTSRRAGA